MLDSIMLWNEPNNMSHWDFEIDSDWSQFAATAKAGAAAVRAENPGIVQVLGGISPIDASFLERMDRFGVLKAVDAIAVHGFPLDWNHWTIHEWPSKLREIREFTEKPLWVSEVGVSSFGAEEVQEFGLTKTAELLMPEVDRIYWYSLFDLPRAWPATTRHREAEGSSYYRHFYMGLYREDGSPKLAARHFSKFAPALGICQWFHFEDHRLEQAVQLFRDLGVTRLRTGLSWADWERPDSARWFDKQMKLLEPFHVTGTFCFTPQHRGVRPHHTSPPLHPEEFGEFCATMIRRYAS